LVNFLYKVLQGKIPGLNEIGSGFLHLNENMQNSNIQKPDSYKCIVNNNLYNIIKINKILLSKGERGIDMRLVISGSPEEIADLLAEMQDLQKVKGFDFGSLILEEEDSKEPDEPDEQIRRRVNKLYSL